MMAAAYAAALPVESITDNDWEDAKEEDIVSIILIPAWTPLLSSL